MFERIKAPGQREKDREYAFRRADIGIVRIADSG